MVGGLQKEFLVVEVDVKLEEVVPGQLLNAHFVSLDLVLDPHDFGVALLIQLQPEFFYFRDPVLMGLMGQLGWAGLPLDQHQVFVLLRT